MIKSTIRKTENTKNDFNECNCRTILKKCINNGIISTLHPTDPVFDKNKGGVKD